MKRELTDRFLKSLDWPEVGRMEVSDTKRVGLRLRLYSSRRAVWMYEKRVKGGAKRKHTFGAWPEPVSLSEARARALEIEAEAARGFDRVLAAKERELDDERAKSRNRTVQEVLDAYAELHLSRLRRGHERKQQIQTALSQHLSQPMMSLTRSMLQEAIDAKAVEGRLVYANRIRSALKAFTAWAWNRDYLDEDVGERLTKAARETIRERKLSLVEVRAIWAASFQMGETWGPLIRLLILTAQRRASITGLRRGEVDLEQRTISKAAADEKNARPHITHLSEPALHELKAVLARTESKARSALLFSTTGKTPVSGWSKAKARLDRLLGDEVGPWRIHDLRTAFASHMAVRGVPEGVVDRVLNHAASASAASVVARTYQLSDLLPQRAEALERWAEIVTMPNE